MSGLSKRAKAIAEKVDSAKVYALTEALDLLKDLSSVKFSETVEVSVNLGVDPKKSDQVVRGATVLPNGTGKSVRVAVFTQGANVEIAEKAGAVREGIHRNRHVVHDMIYDSVMFSLIPQSSSV